MVQRSGYFEYSGRMQLYEFSQFKRGFQWINAGPTVVAIWPSVGLNIVLQGRLG